MEEKVQMFSPEQLNQIERRMVELDYIFDPFSDSTQPKTLPDCSEIREPNL
jgi:hypothetical protein